MTDLQGGTTLILYVYLFKESLGLTYLMGYLLIIALMSFTIVLPSSDHMGSAEEF
jgi:hypothetical protein